MERNEGHRVPERSKQTVVKPGKSPKSTATTVKEFISSPGNVIYPHPNSPIFWVLKFSFLTLFTNKLRIQE